MSVQNNLLVSAAIMAATLMTTLQVSAEVTTPERQISSQSSIPQSAVRSAPGSLDGFLVSCLVNGNQGEIALSRLAQERATNPEVKAFAEQLVKEHSEMLKQLEALGGTASIGRTGSAGADATQEPVGQEARTANQPQTSRDQSSTQTQTTSRPATSAHNQSGQATVEQLVQIKDQVAQECLQRAKRELSDMEGAKFDKAYTGMQVGAHHQMAAQLSVFKSHASPSLQAVITKAMETTEKHLEHAKNLCEQLDSQREPKTARRDTPAKE